MTSSPHGTSTAGDAQGEGDRVVLVVDDDAVILESLKDILEATLEGVEALTAMSGPEALEVLAHRKVDLIVSDYKMPGMDGITFLLEARKVTPDTPAIIITAFPELDVALQAINDAHVEAFITKPFAPGYVIDMVRSILREPGPRRFRQRSPTGASGPVAHGAWPASAGIVPASDWQL